MSADHSHLSLEQKMRIVQQLRENSRNNSGVMHGISDRDRIYADENEEKTISTLKLRASIACVLFMAFCVMYTKGERFLGVTASQVMNAVEEDYTANLFDFVEEIPYTLHDVTP